MYQLKITINDIAPSIWRLIEVPESFSLNKLHHIIQLSFGWTNSHLYRFGDWKNKIGDPILWDDGETIWDKKVKIKDVLRNPGDTLKYEYDMGDSWKHKVILKKIEKVGSTVARCIDGKRAAPPEDCGGVGGYLELIHHLRHPEQDGYLELLEWLGDDYDPEEFNLVSVNEELRRLTGYIRLFEKENDLNYEG
jgi:hypothetical protein